MALNLVRERASASRLSESEALKVFVSYSRQDMAFAQEIVAGLTLLGGFDISIDTEAIHEGEEWRARLSSLIAAADTIVFVLTPNSATSQICQWELEEAKRLSKRILPIQAAALDSVKPPKQVSALHYVRFDSDENGTPRSFIVGLEALQNALNTDIDWLREHTRLLVRAREWDAAGHPENRLISGDDVTLAKAWLENRPQDAPAPTELHHDFISSSEKAEESRVLAERHRVEELRTALANAEAAQAKEADARRRVVQRTVIGLIASVFVAFVGVAGGWAYKVIDARRDFEREALRIDIAGDIVAYATAKGELAMDAIQGVGPKKRTSPYTLSLLEAFRTSPKRSITQTLISASQHVVARSKSKQRPFISTRMNGELFLWRQPRSRKRMALVVWVDDAGFAYNPLIAPKRDAEAFVELLRSAGYSDEEIVLLGNPSRGRLLRALDKVSRLSHIGSAFKFSRFGYIPLPAKARALRKALFAYDVAA